MLPSRTLSLSNWRKRSISYADSKRASGKTETGSKLSRQAQSLDSVREIGIPACAQYAAMTGTYSTTSIALQAQAGQNHRGEKMKTRMAFGLLLFMPMLATGQEQSTREPDNGYWWVKQSETFKLGFINGYALAMTNVYDRTTLTCLAEKNINLPAGKGFTVDVLNACTQTATLFDFSGIRFGQLLEGMDDFYKDFGNKAVSVTAGLFYVRDELKGKPAKELEDELNIFRHGPTPAKQ
jgi:hypothetical protein